MNQADLKDRYYELYDYMAQSKDPKNMKAFGCVMNEMYEYLVETKPDVAEEMLLQLEGIRWQQYLTAKEAEKITAGMNPKAPWTMQAWKTTMESLGLPMEEPPYYNDNALYVEMSKMYSDFGEEIAALLGKPLSPTDRDIIAACYKMALKTLKDRDHVYSIRKYFLW